MWIKKQEEWFFTRVLSREILVRGMVDSDVFIEYSRLILFFFSDVLFNVLLPSSKQVGFIKYIVSSSCRILCSLIARTGVIDTRRFFVL